MKAARRHKVDTDAPWETLPERAREFVYAGAGSFPGIHGFFEEVESYRYKLHVRVFLSRYRSQSVCRVCHGARLKPAALAVRVAGLTIAEFAVLTIDAAARLLGDLGLTAWESVVAREILRQLNAKLTFLLRVGLGYLTLSRQTRTLSGGEAQRITWRTSWARSWSGRSTCSTSRRSACTCATPRGSPISAGSSPRPATPSWWSSTTASSSPRPTTSWSSDRAPASAAARSSSAGRRPSSRRRRTRSPRATSPAASRSRCRRSAAAVGAC